MKITARRNRFERVGTAYSLGDGVILDSEGDTFDRVGTVLDRRDGAQDIALDRNQKLELFPTTSKVAWSRGYERNWHDCFGGNPVAFTFTNVKMSDIGTFYKGPDGVELKVEGGELIRVGKVLDLSGRAEVSGNGISASFPVPTDFKPSDLEEILRAIREAKNANENPESRLGRIAKWVEWLSLGVNAGQLIQTLAPAALGGS